MNKEQHEKWLKKHGVSKQQNKERIEKNKKYIRKEIISIAPGYYGNLSNTIAPPVLSNSIWDKLNGESQETIDEIKRKATMVLPAYNKGGLTYVNDKEMIKVAGKKI